MNFNKIVRGNKRASNTEIDVYNILDSGFLCHVAFQHEQQSMIIPTAYGREEDCLYLHGSSKNFMLNKLLTGQTACIAVTHLDGLVLAKTLFYSSMNYRSVVLFGKAILVENEDEKVRGLQSITEHIIKGRSEEVIVGDKSQLDATIVMKFKIDSASAKIRNGGPGEGDSEIKDNIWSGHIPLRMQALQPVLDEKFGINTGWSESIINFYERFK